MCFPRGWDVRVNPPWGGHLRSPGPCHCLIAFVCIINLYGLSPQGRCNGIKSRTIVNHVQPVKTGIVSDFLEQY